MSNADGAKTDGGSLPGAVDTMGAARGVTIGISIWLVAAVALVAGIIIGFVSGYTAGQRASVTTLSGVSRNESARPPSRASEPSERSSSGQPFTEDTVSEPVRVDPESIVTAPEPTAPAPRAAGRAPTSTGTLSRRSVRARREAPVEPVASGPGSLQILSRPSGAQVVVDGRAVGRTPLVIADVRSGAHDVRIELAGFRRWATSVQVTPGNRTRVAASLEQ